MPYQQVACPFCHQILVDDGSVTGQVVVCPACHNRVQMPGVAFLTAAPPPVICPATPVNRPRYRSRSRPTTNSFTTVAWVVGGVVVAGLLVGSLMSDFPRILSGDLAVRPGAKNASVKGAVSNTNKQAERRRQYEKKYQELLDKRSILSERWAQERERLSLRLSQISTRLDRLSPDDPRWQRTFQELMDMDTALAKFKENCTEEMHQHEIQLEKLLSEYEDVLE